MPQGHLLLSARVNLTSETEDDESETPFELGAGHSLGSIFCASPAL